MSSRTLHDAGPWIGFTVALALTSSACASVPSVDHLPAPGGNSLVELFRKGGPIMWPLLASSIVAVTVAIERLLFLWGERRRRSEAELGDFFVEVGRGNFDGAIAIARHSQDAVVSTLGYGLEHRDQSLGHALGFAETRTLKRYRRGIGVLDTVITLAPLLGLLGTVTGMMGSFSMIGQDLDAPGVITGGIAEALIATAFGLCIAMVALLPFNYLNSCLEQLETDMLAAVSQLKLLVEAGREVPAVATAPAERPAGDTLRLAVAAGGGR